MAFVITQNCCTDASCVPVCPVDCIHSTDESEQYFINPAECIDCGVCEPECPAEAILPDTEPGLEKWLELNATFSAQWPNLTVKKPSPADADEYKGVPDKFDKFFSPEPGGN